MPHTDPRNPWTSLPATRPFVLPEDATAISAFNLRAHEKKRYDLTLFPEPYFGHPSAPVIVLALNPGWGPNDAEVHAQQGFAELARRSLTHDLAPYPFLHLQPGAETDGARWWNSKTRRLVEEAGFDAVAKNLFCIQYFPYHSKEYGASGLRVPSQQYGFTLLRAGIARGAEVVVMRSLHLWAVAVPELSSYPRVHLVRNKRNPTLSPANLGTSFAAVLSRVKTGA